MRTYEALYIVRPDLPDDEIQTVATNVESLVTAEGGAIVRSEIWGRRRLAYEVQRCAEGCYVLMRFTAAPACIARLENHFRLTDAIIRYLVVHFDKKTLTLEARQKKRKEAEARSHTTGARPEHSNSDVQPRHRETDARLPEREPDGQPRDQEKADAPASTPDADAPDKVLLDKAPEVDIAMDKEDDVDQEKPEAAEE